MTDLTNDKRERRQQQAHTVISNALAASWAEWRRIGRRPDFAQAAHYAMDGLGDLAAEILADGTMFKGLDIKNGVVTLETEPARELLLLLVASMRGMLDGYGAENYLETEITADKPKVSLDLHDGQNPQDSYTVTIQRRYRPTPHEFRQRAEKRLERILAECDAIEAEVHGQHDEDDDGMREAVRRIRAAAGD
ncbi:hypothetical protein [Streptomyces asiaticus]|uniref:hypothetical protein n=1 Tax=Streptomyces asiaticus TaxID=114695 RepID=UPI0038148CD2